ncbi:MAG: DUF5667 domain-containing protein [Candidatus Nanohaloarchaea archaeon]
MRKSAAVFGMMAVIGMSAAYSGGLPAAGSTPGSMMYGLDRLHESIGLLLTFDEDREAVLRARFAGERLAEARKLASRNATGRAETALEMYRSSIKKAESLNSTAVADLRSSYSEALGSLAEMLPGQKLKDQGTEDSAKNHGFMATGRVVQG